MPEEPKKWKWGDIGPDGLVFWGYDKYIKSGERWLTPEKFGLRQAKQRKRQKSPREKALHKLRKQSPEYKARQKDYRQSPERKAREKKRRQSPEYKKREKSWNQSQRAKLSKLACVEKSKQQDAAIQFFTLTNAAREISKALETKPTNTDEKTRDDSQ